MKSKTSKIEGNRYRFETEMERKRGNVSLDCNNRIKRIESTDYNYKTIQYSFLNKCVMLYWCSISCQILIDYGEQGAKWCDLFAKSLNIITRCHERINVSPPSSSSLHCLSQRKYSIFRRWTSCVLHWSLRRRERSRKHYANVREEGMKTGCNIMASFGSSFCRVCKVCCVGRLALKKKECYPNTLIFFSSSPSASIVTSHGNSSEVEEKRKEIARLIQWICFCSEDDCEWNLLCSSCLYFSRPKSLLLNQEYADDDDGLDSLPPLIQLLCHSLLLFHSEEMRQSAIINGLPSHHTLR